jgi:signal transduction histidine kinase
VAWLSRKKTKNDVDQETARIAQELYLKNVDLAHTNRTLSLLRTIDGLVLDPSNSIKDIAKGVAQAIIENSNYLFAIIFIDSITNNDPHSFSESGYCFAPATQVTLQTAEMIKGTKMLHTRPWFSSKELSELIDVGSINEQMINETFGNSAGYAHKIIQDAGAKSVCLVKLLAQGRLTGVMFIGVNDDSKSVKVEQLEQLGRVGEATGIALDNKMLTEKYEQVLKKLQMSNDKLKALDEAKDEFISMASHQLRTPLTSVKGYLSMVLEGDAGEINENQQKMLQQAFTSSQRMVYLISDLLNVSRLKTGKFIIDPKPTYLPDVIESEMDQLRESAKSRNLELSFNKPENFPMIDLDETKIRQVIMNFTDNAIYYTPSGGHIMLDLKTDNSMITFTVTDDGIGVPKEEQPNLFTKFYRAGNAKSARPDGTGLGLFMAKKVIVASGGALVFKSEIGKGSTFGFTFPLHPQVAAQQITEDEEEKIDSIDNQLAQAQPSSPTGNISEKSQEAQVNS